MLFTSQVSAEIEPGAMIHESQSVAPGSAEGRQQRVSVLYRR